MRRPGKTASRLAWLVLILAAVVLRFHGLGQEGLWVDEAYTALLAQGGTGAILTRLQADDAPPLFYLLQKGTLALAGTSESAVRLLPALAGLAAVGAAFWLARRHCPRAAVAAAILFAFSSMAAFYSRQARSYSLLHLFTLLLLLATLDLRKRPTPRRALAFGLAGLALLYTHNLAPLLLLPAILLAAPRLFAGGSPRRAGLVALAVLAIGSAPWWASVFGQLRIHEAENGWIGQWWSGRPLALAPLYSCAVFTNGAGPALRPPVPLPGLPPGLTWIRPILWLAAAAGLISCLLGLRHGPQRPGGAKAGTSRMTLHRTGDRAATAGQRGSPDGDREAWVGDRDAPAAFLLFTFVPMIALVLGSLALGPSYVLGRTDTLALPGFLLCLASGWTRLGWRRWARWAPAALLALWVASGVLAIVPSWSAASPIAKGADAALARRLGDEMRAGDALVFTDLARPSMEYYGRRLRWWTRPAWVGSFPPALDRNPAAVPPTPFDSIGAYQREARALRSAWDRRDVQRVWVLALRQETPPGAPPDWPHEPEPPPSDRRMETASGISYPANVLVATLAGLRPIPVLCEYRQDWVRGDRLVLRIDRASWVSADSLPTMEIEK